MISNINYSPASESLSPAWASWAISKTTCARVLSRHAGRAKNREMLALTLCKMSNLGVNIMHN